MHHVIKSIVSYFGVVFLVWRGCHPVDFKFHKAAENVLLSRGGHSALNLPGCVSMKVMDMGFFLAPSE